MKLSKPEGAAILFVCGFILFFAGWFFRGNSPQAGTYVISTENLIPKTVVSPTPEVFIPDVLIDLNTATQSELETLPGIGSVRAAAIIAYREENGPFERIEQITRVAGIGQSTFKDLEMYITVTAEEGGEAP